ncbi:septation ring formation regulator EzrA [Oceanobacillus kapialis]|uniref:Septation ring formation regulator EzrA n=1 Tax=Oceanobacillus kapialis TaxID=481353 RepID=A0ABW5PX01_9BACI
MAYFIGIVLVIITLIIIGLILRKRVYDVVDRYEAWKMDIMGRNIASQLGRIKALNLSGETQDKFESWKERWERILTKELPDIEEYLFDAEEAADKYRFSKAKKILNKVEEVLQGIEANIEKLLAEVDNLIESEELSRKEMDTLKPEIRGMKKSLSQNRYQYGKAEQYFDKQLDVLQEKAIAYEQATDSGDYMEAKQIVDQLKMEINELEEKFDAFPELYKKCKQELPAQLDQLFAGLKEMREEGYHVDHLAFEKEIRTYQERLASVVEAMEKGDTEEVEGIVEEIEERIKEMYELLEKEALAKSYLDTQVPGYQQAVADMNQAFLETTSEVEQLKKAYYFEDGDMERYMALEKSIGKLTAELEELSDKMTNDKASHSELRDMVEEGYRQLEEMKENHEAFKVRIRNLRKDELEAKEKLTEMRNQLYDIQRKLKKSNVPGIPTFIWNSMESATEKNNRVIKTLEKQPLDMTEVQQALSEAASAVEQVAEQTDMMLEQAFLTEQVIQYANRYRSQYPLLAAKLAESERLFRAYEYELALEQAAKAIEEIEPGALKRIEEYQLTAN